MFDSDNPAAPPRKRTRFERLQRKIRSSGHRSLGRTTSVLATLMARRTTGFVQRVIWPDKLAAAERLQFSDFEIEIVRLVQPLAESYNPRPYLGKITLICAKIGDSSFENSPDRGWTDVAKGGLEIYEFPCSHEAIFQHPVVHLVAARLNDCLDAAESLRGVDWTLIPSFLSEWIRRMASLSSSNVQH